MFASKCMVITVLLLTSDVIEGNIQLEFIDEPVSQNVSEGSQVTFNCTATTLSQYWLINGLSVAHQSNSNRGIVTPKELIINASTGLKIYSLIVPANVTNDNITVQCIIYNTLQNQYIYSSKGILRIQGVLGTVDSLQAEWLNYSSIQVSFIPPYTLDGVPIRYYTIELLSTKLNSTQYLTTVETVMVISNLLVCDHYDHNITVSAWNDAGQGNKTTGSIIMDEDVADSGGFSLITTSVSIKYSSNHKLNRVFLSTIVNFSTLMAKSDSVISVTVYLINTTDKVIIFTADCTIDTPSQCDDVIFNISDYDDGSMIVTVNLTGYIQTGYYYSSITSITNCIGHMINSSEYIFDTFTSVTTDVKDHVNYDVTSTDNMLTMDPMIICHNCITTIPIVTTSVTNTSTASVISLEIMIGLSVLCTLLVIVVIILLMVALVKYKKDSNRFKKNIILSVKDGSDNQDKITMNQVISNQSTLVHLYQSETRRRVSRDLPVPPQENINPLYESINDALSAPPTSIVPRQHDVVELVDCPAYGSLQQTLSVPRQHNVVELVDCPAYGSLQQARKKHS